MGDEPGPATRLWTPAFVALALAELAYFAAQGLLIPTTSLYAEGPLGGGEVGVGIAFGAFGVTAVILRPFAGRAADVRGRRPLLIGGALLCAAAIGAHLLATNLAILIVLRLTLGVAEAFFFVAGFAMVADLAPPGRAGEALSYNSLALYLGIALGPGLGEWLVSLGGFDLAWIGGAALALVGGLIAIGLNETAVKAVDPGPLRLIHRRALLPSLGLFSGITAMAGFLAFVAIWVQDLGMTGTGAVLLVFGFVVIGMRIVFARLPDAVEPFSLAAAALGLIGLGLVAVALLRSELGVYVGAALTAVGVAFTTPAFFAAIVQRVSAAERGVAFGTTSLFLDLAFGGGPILLGFVAGAFGLAAGFVAAGMVAGVGAVGTAVAALGARRMRSAASAS